MQELLIKSFADRALVVRYIIAGGAGVVANLGTFFVVSEVLHEWYIVAGIFAFLAGLIVAFSLQKLWTFRGEAGRTRLQFGVYSALAVFNLVANILLLYGMVTFLGIWDLLAQALSTGLVAFWTFLINRNYTFSRL